MRGQRLIKSSSLEMIWTARMTASESGKISSHRGGVAVVVVVHSCGVAVEIAARSIARERRMEPTEKTKTIDTKTPRRPSFAANNVAAMAFHHGLSTAVKIAMQRIG